MDAGDADAAQGVMRAPKRTRRSYTGSTLIPVDTCVSSRVFLPLKGQGMFLGPVRPHRRAVGDCIRYLQHAHNQNANALSHEPRARALLT